MKGVECLLKGAQTFGGSGDIASGAILTLGGVECVFKGVQPLGRSGVLQENLSCASGGIFLMLINCHRRLIIVQMSCYEPCHSVFRKSLKGIKCCSLVGQFVTIMKSAQWACTGEFIVGIIIEF